MKELSNAISQTDIVKAGAISIHYLFEPEGFGKDRKSQILIFNLPFEPYKIGTITDIDVTTGIRKDAHITLKPTEEGIREVLQHEYQHVEDYAYGFDLGNGLSVNNSNCYRIDARVRKFVLETRAYIRGVNYTTQFGTSHQAFISSCIKFEGYLNKSAKQIDFPNINAYDKKLMQYQWNETKKIMPLIEKAKQELLRF